MKPYCETVAMPDERFRITSFYSAQFEHAVTVHPHWHPEVEMLFVESGRAAQQVNKHYFATEAGDVIIIGRDQLHSTYSYQNIPCRILVIQFDAARLLYPDLLNPGNKTEDVFGTNVLIKNPIPTNTAAGIMIRDAILEAHEELCGKRGGYKPFVRSSLNRIAGLLTREGLITYENNSGKEQKFIRQVLDNTFKLIDESYCEGISLKDAASASNLSTPHFCRLFKMATGMTFTTYLSFYRINRAEKMLSSGETLTSIAMECGFGSVSSFIRNFKKYKNCTPSAYKKI